ncbi:hypothetical protein K438DRAFT_1962932 [Mycena galopus ATCC 62051]|nr:hypothetical protein K438DRAFT_1962932 [Mycena galopus ATCC 62051]
MHTNNPFICLPCVNRGLSATCNSLGFSKACANCANGRTQCTISLDGATFPIVLKDLRLLCRWGLQSWVPPSAMSYFYVSEVQDLVVLFRNQANILPSAYLRAISRIRTTSSSSSSFRSLLVAPLRRTTWSTPTCSVTLPPPFVLPILTPRGLFLLMRRSCRLVPATSQTGRDIIKASPQSFSTFGKPSALLFSDPALPNASPSTDSAPVQGPSSPVPEPSSDPAPLQVSFAQPVVSTTHSSTLPPVTPPVEPSAPVVPKSPTHSFNWAAQGLTPRRGACLTRCRGSRGSKERRIEVPDKEG